MVVLSVISDVKPVIYILHFCRIKTKVSLKWQFNMQVYLRNKTSELSPHYFYSVIGAVNLWGSILSRYVHRIVLPESTFHQTKPIVDIKFFDEWYSVTCSGLVPTLEFPSCQLGFFTNPVPWDVLQEIEGRNKRWGWQVLWIPSFKCNFYL